MKGFELPTMFEREVHKKNEVSKSHFLLYTLCAKLQNRPRALKRAQELHHIQH